MNTSLRPCSDSDFAAILAIVNAAAEAYRGTIPSDRWHDPYMSEHELRHEIAADLAFWGFERSGELLGVMGVQPVRDVDLIRHAYVLPAQQRLGVGAALLQHILQRGARPMLVGTWATAHWAIDFYRRHGFELVPGELKTDLLRTYWTIPERQVETSVVLVHCGRGLFHEPS
jgi:GNAT superfamily N-acetyltransferase